MFALPARLSFRHLYFSPDRRGERARDDAARPWRSSQVEPRGLEARSVAGRSVHVPGLLWRPHAAGAGTGVRARIREAVAKLEPGSWQGPMESGYGWHLVFVDSVIPGRVPAFEEVEPDVKTAWLGEQKAEAWRKAYEEMRAKYTVLLPVPADGAAPSRPRPPASPRPLAPDAARCPVEPLSRGLVLGCSSACCWLGLAAVPAARAHESRPAYLEIEETAPGRYTVLWRTPVLAGMRLPVVLRFPEGVRELREPLVQQLSDSLLERRWIDAGPAGPGRQAHRLSRPRADDHRGGGPGRSCSTAAAGWRSPGLRSPGWRSTRRAACGPSPATSSGRGSGTSCRVRTTCSSCSACS